MNNEIEKGSAEQSIYEDTRLRSSLRWYVTGLGFLGAAVGILAGLSESPVVATILPLLFGVVGGAGGFYLAREDLTTAEGHYRLRLMGRAITVFVVFVLLGTAYGIMLRKGLSISSFLPTSGDTAAAEADLIELEPEGPEDALSLALFRARLRRLGASVEEQRAILRMAKESGTDKLVKGPAPNFYRLGLAAKEVSDELKTQDAGDASATPRPLVSYFRDAGKLMEENRKLVGDDNLEIREKWGNDLDILLADLLRGMNENDTAGYLGAETHIRDLILRFAIELHGERRSVRLGKIERIYPSGKEVDDFLRTVPVSSASDAATTGGGGGRSGGPSIAN